MRGCRASSMSEGPPPAPLGPSRRIVYKLAALFSVDAFAGGFVVQSLLALWLFDRFGMSLVGAGLFFFWSGVLAAFSFPVAAWLARRIGLVNTMVFTHIPSSLFLIAAAVAPDAGDRACLSAAAGCAVADGRADTVVLRHGRRHPARACRRGQRNGRAEEPGCCHAAPALAGALYAAGLEAWPLIICGVLKIIYDVALLYAFRHVKPPEEMGPAPRSSRVRGMAWRSR